MKRSKTFSTVLVALLVMGLVAACSSDDSPSSDGSESTAGADTPTGEPIRLGMILREQYMEKLPQGAEAAMKVINANGGIQGRPLELVTCSNDDSAAVAAACATKFASDSTIIATVGDNNSFGADTNPTLEQAGVAGIGTSPLGAGDFASPRVFAINSGGLQFLPAAGFAYDTLEAEDIGMATLDTPTAQALPDLINDEVLASRGTEISSTVAIPQTAGDVSSQAAALADSDAILLAFPQDLVVRFIQSSRQQGNDGPMITSETIAEAGEVWEALGPDQSEGLYGAAYFNKNSDGYARYVEELQDYDSDQIPNDFSSTSWLAVRIFADVAEGLTTIDRESVFDAMNNLKDYDTDGMTPIPIDFTVPGTAFGGTAPRLVPSALYVYFSILKDGEWQPLEGDPEPIPVFE